MTVTVKEVAADRRPTFNETADGFETDLHFDIDGLSFSAGDNMHTARHVRKVPQIGARHPRDPNIRCVRRQGQQIGPRTVRVSCFYATPKAGDIGSALRSLSGEAEIDVATISEQTFRDVRGQFMVIKYAGRPGLVNILGTTILRPSQFRISSAVLQAEVERPVLRATISRLETALPLTNADNYMARVNSRRWSGYAAKTWLCGGVRSQTAQSGTRHLVTYDLLYKPETWRFKGFINITGDVPLDATEGNGLQFFDVYRSADFNRLGIRLR